MKLKILSHAGQMRPFVKESLESADKSKRTASIIGLISLLWSGLSVAAAVAEGCNSFWQVKARGVKDKIAGLVWILGALVIVGLAALSTSIVAFVKIPFVGLITAFAASFAVGTALFWLTQRVFTNVKLPAKEFLPGSLIGGATLAAFQLLGAYIVPLISGSARLYKTLAGVILVFGLLLLAARLLLVSVAINVIRWERSHGTVSLAINAPALPGGTWAMAGRGGQISDR